MKAKNLADVIRIARRNNRSLSVWSMICGSEKSFLEDALELNGIFFKNYAKKTETGYVMIGTHPEYAKHQAIVATRIVNLAERYDRYCHYMNEIRHDWINLNKVNYADNSEVQVQKSSLTGETREVELVAPHGDICF